MNLYFLKADTGQTALMTFEMKYIFEEKIKDNLIFSKKKFDIFRSCYIKEVLEIEYQTNDFSKLLDYVSTLKSDMYRVSYVKHDKNVHSYEERINICRSLASLIEGDFDLYNPLNHFGITLIEDTYYFGKLTINDKTWKKHLKKPQSLSYSLPTRLARAVINIIDENDKVLDMCAGVGTVLLEGINAKLDIVGNDINPLMINMLNENLKYFNYEAKITCLDARYLEECYDTIILDLPYGVYIDVADDLQKDLLLSALKNSKQVIFISNKNIKNYALESHYIIKDETYVVISNFKRYIYILNNVIK